MRGFTVILLISLVIPAGGVVAQRNQPFATGEFLRLTAPACGVEEQAARFLRLYRDTLTVQADSELTLPVADIARLDVSRGISNRSTFIGIGAGALAGILIGTAVASAEDSDMSGGSPSTNTGTPSINSGTNGGSVTLSGAAVAPIAGAFIGGFLGGLVGKALRKHSWEEVPLDRLRVSFAPQRDGLTLGVSLSH